MQVLDVPRKTSGSFLATFFLGFTGVVLTTGYTAVVTTTLLQQSQVGATSLDDAIRMGYTICAETAVHADLVSRYPQIQNLLAEYSAGVGLSASELEAMDAGECDAAIVYQVHLATALPSRRSTMHHRPFTIAHRSAMHHRPSAIAHHDPSRFRIRRVPAVIRTSGIYRVSTTLTIATPRSASQRRWSPSPSACPPSPRSTR